MGATLFHSSLLYALRAVKKCINGLLTPLPISFLNKQRKYLEKLHLIYTPPPPPKKKNILHH